ncbi:MAG: 50S ribosomal protein L34e [archaeon]
MPEGRFKSRTYRRVEKKLPGGKTVLHHEKRNVGKASCASCGAVLPAVPRARTTKLMNMPKTKKRPQRPYGGVLCSKCARAKIVAEARA